MALYERLAGDVASHGTSPEAPMPFALGPAFQETLPNALTGMRWEPAPDLERWLTAFYHFFEMKGYRGMISANMFHIAALTFTFAFSFGLFFFVDWTEVMSCDSEESCRHISIFYERPFADVGFWRGLVLLLFFLFFAYWLFNVVNAFHTFKDASEMREYYKERLGIATDDVLRTMEWSEVVARLVQQQKVAPFCVVQDEITALDIANIIMREDNFVVALTNHRAFTSHLPPWIPPRLVYTRAVQGCLRTAIFRWAFDRRSRLRMEFLTSPNQLAARLRYMGLLTLLLVLPVWVFVTMVFFMRHAEEFRADRSSPFRREWTDYAKWTFREFNELHHQFKERMRAAQLVAEDYVQNSRPPTPLRDALRRFAKFVAGAVLAVLLIVAVWDDTPLFFVKIWDRNLLWYLAFFGFLFAVADNANLDDDGRHSSGAPALPPGTPLLMHTEMMRLVRCTHYLPPTWRPPAALAAMAGGCSGPQRARLCQHFARLRAEFLGNFFVPRIQALGEELLGVVLAPLLLGIYLPQAAPDIARVLRQSRYASQNLGDFCVFGCLDPARNGGEFYGAPYWQGEAQGSSTDGPRSLSEGSRAARSLDCRIVSQGGKLEKSIMSFILGHRLPWCPPTGSDGPWESPPVAYVPPCLYGLGAAPLQASQRPAAKLGRGSAASASMAIPLQDMSASCSSAPCGLGGPSTAAPAAAEEEDECEIRLEEGNHLAGSVCELPKGSDVDRADCWGYPTTALSLLRELEDFQQREMARDSPHRRLYGLFPEDLLAMDRATPEAWGEVLPLPAVPVSGPACGRAGPLDSHAGRVSCSAHYFWLEVLYDFHSGRHAAQFGDAGGGAAFELLASRPDVS